MNHRPALQVAAAIIRRGGLVLACQRAAGKRHAGKWEFPGGKCEAGESIEQCLRRELREELGIEARIGPLLARTAHEYPDGLRVELFFHLVTELEGEIRNLEFAELRWLRPVELPALDFLDGDRAVVEMLARG